MSAHFSMKVYAIRQKSTGFFMPVGNGRRGHTWREPKAAKLPRIFRRRQDAAAALRWWLEGRYWSREDGDLYRSEPTKARDKDDMEVVELMLIECAGVFVQWKGVEDCRALS